MSAKLACVAIISSSVLFRDGLVRILAAGRYKVGLSAEALDEAAIAAISQDATSAVIVHCDGQTNLNFGSIRILKERNPAVGIIIHAGHYNWEEARAAFQVGANAYLVHVANSKAFLKMLDVVIMGETLLPVELLENMSDATQEIELLPVQSEDLPNATDSQVRMSAQCRLSTQERQILRHLVEGCSNKLIARKVRIAEATVKVHVKAILRKLNATNRTQAAVWAINNKERAGLPK